jgi:recombinase-like zinc beta ribbon protein
MGSSDSQGRCVTGPALLQGRVLCGLCGERMGVHHNQEHGRTVPVYICHENIVRRGGRVCQTVPGKIVDPAIGALLVELMTPMTLGVTLAVQQELEARAAEMAARWRSRCSKATPPTR